MKIVILDGYTANPGDLSWGSLKEMGEVTVYERTRREEIAGRAADADIVLTNKVVMDREMMALLPRLKYIGVLAQHRERGADGVRPPADSHKPHRALRPAEPTGTMG